MAVQSLDAKFINALPPVADAFSATVYTDVISMKRWGHAEFFVIRAAGATGTFTITAEACDDVVPTNTFVIPFHYRVTGAGTDVYGEPLTASSSGYTVAAGENRIDVIELEVEALGQSAYPYLRLKCVEVVNSPVLGGILARLSGCRYAGATDQTDLT